MIFSNVSVLEQIRARVAKKCIGLYHQTPDWILPTIILEYSLSHRFLQVIRNCTESGHVA